jgi:hypothetical protein
MLRRGSGTSVRGARAGKWRSHVVLRGADPAAVLGGSGTALVVDVDPESLV